MDQQEKVIFSSILICYTLIVIGLWEYVVQPLVAFAKEIILLY
jgi:hypothetical protein